MPECARRVRASSCWERVARLPRAVGGGAERPDWRRVERWVCVGFVKVRSAVERWGVVGVGRGRRLGWEVGVGVGWLVGG